MPQPSPLYTRHRFPGEVISHAVWLSYRFLLSYRDVEELLAERGITVSYETIRRWCQKFDQTFADGLRRRARPGTSGMWMRYSSRSTGANIVGLTRFGEQVMIRRR